jgi:hypothetical protein
MLRLPKRGTPWLTARCLFFNILLKFGARMADIISRYPSQNTAGDKVVADPAPTCQ